MTLITPQIPKWDKSIIPLVDHPSSQSSGRRGINFSLPKLSKAVEGIEKGELVAIVAPPGEGKSQLGRTLALDFIKQAANVLYLTFELSLAQSLAMFQSAGLNEMESKKLLLAAKEHTVKDIAFVEKIMEENRGTVDCLIIDDFHSLEEKYGFKQPDNTAMFLRALAGKLKDLALKENCIVITMAHLRKDAIRMRDSSIGDIAHSGGLGQVADTIFSIRREKENFSTIEVLKSRWSGVKIKVKVAGANKRFLEVDEVHETHGGWLND